MKISRFVTARDLYLASAHAVFQQVLLVDVEIQAGWTAKTFEAHDAAVSAFGDAAARIFEQHDLAVQNTLAELDDELLELSFALDGDTLANKLHRVTQSAQVEEAI
jgi:hypothetical protein